MGARCAAESMQADRFKAADRRGCPSFFPDCRLVEAMQLAEEAGVSIDFEAVMQSG